ncbi:GNAT family N-acetyltransferase [Erwinia tasmaniensis]|uniref:Acetyltransferase YafP n=1 Tax=Erwinia tasmaniensis (strain DSM 17950 / CFBP 7177 / CIP 109463 / NCPPB 4357 / Et1/99) TaxID=465817 RepID=B2VEV5_ERWT9|nr:GNAT family N-acetyltransferase [Erwinia tasmaniensis]CAO96773.1 Putative acetyltransferase YafP [Erwinia tasmaniensis Et1/99]
MEMIIRRYLPADFPQVIAVFRRAIRSISARDYSQQQTDAWSQADPDELRRRLDSSDVWVASHDNIIAGFTNLEAGGYLDLLFTDPEYQRNGVATLLLDKLERAAIEKGLTHIMTEASITAKPFFMQRGYQLVEQQSVVVRGQEFINFRMRKPLLSLG